MEIPLQLQFNDIEATPDLEERIRDKVARLERYCDQIIGCRVAVERPRKAASTGGPYRVRIEATIPPNHQVVVTKDPGDHDLGDSLTTVINSAFDAAERQVKEIAQRQRDEVKTHTEPRALVVRMEPDEDFGFIKTPEGRDVYFHRNAVTEGNFDRLSVGTEVRFEWRMGRDGPQATTVQVVGKPGERAGSGEGEPPVEPPRGWQD